MASSLATMLVLLCAMLGEAMNPCKDNTKFAGDADSGVGGHKCSTVAGMVATFTADAASCLEKIDVDGSQLSRASMVGTVSPTCCDGTPHVCDEFVLSSKVCKDTTKFVGAADAGVGGGHCSAVADMFATFTPDGESCLGKINFGGSQHPRGSWLSTISPTCCDGTPHMCAEFVLSSEMCNDPGQFDPAADAGLGDVKCKHIGGGFVAFVPSTTTCAAKVDVGGTRSTRMAILEIVAPTCCKNTSHVCTDHVPDPEAGGATAQVGGLMALIVTTFMATAREL